MSLRFSKSVFNVHAIGVIKSTQSPIPHTFRSSRVFSKAMSSSSASIQTIGDDGKLTNQTCEPCKRSTPLLPVDEYEPLKNQLEPGWEIKPFATSQDIKVLQKSFQFKNFKYALQFTNLLGQIAEQQKHHPEIILGWGHVEIAWWSHAIGGLHKNDFVCAAKTDEVAAQAEGLKK